MRAAYRAGRERFADLFVIPVIRKGDGRRMEMHQVRYFLAVADTLNFTRAAEQCHVSQPALTRAIQQLEEELGGLLLRRERKLTHLTDFGRLIEPHLRQLFADAEAAKSTARKFLSLQQAQIRLGVMCTIGPARFMGFLAGFRTANPGCELTLVEGVPSGLSRMLMAGELDLAVMAQPEPFSERLDVWPLYRERFGIAFPTGHRLETQNRVRITDVAERNLSAPDQLRIPRLSGGSVARARSRGAGRVSERARGLDPDDGRGRVRGVLPARVLADHSRVCASSRSAIRKCRARYRSCRCRGGASRRRC